MFVVRVGMAFSLKSRSGNFARVVGCQLLKSELVFRRSPAVNRGKDIIPPSQSKMRERVESKNPSPSSELQFCPLKGSCCVFFTTHSEPCQELN